MIEAFLQGAIAFAQPLLFLSLVIGVIVGVIVGVIPGIGASVGCAVLLPFIIFLPPDVGMMVLVALAAVAVTGGSITAILLNIPGESSNAPTCLDGFPMTQKGEGARAMGAAIFASSLGGILPVGLALLMIPAIVPIIMVFRTPEMVMLVVLGLACLALLSGGSAIKGAIAACLGLLLSLIGFQGSTGVYRFTFDTLFLFDGLGIVAVATGVFGVGELFEILYQGQSTISQNLTKSRIRHAFQGVRDVIHFRWLFVRSALIGYIIGVLPGIGGPAAAWIAYAQAKRLSKNSEKFGTGCVEGVIAPEASHNAGESGALLTTMALGIPGSAICALFLGGFLLVGVTPGPKMLVDHLPLAFTLLIGIGLSNVISGTICFFTAPRLARLSNVHIDFLFPVVMWLIFLGAFVAVDSVWNLSAVLAIGLLGFAMRRFGYSRPALILGFVLGGLFEEYLLRSIKIHGATFFMTPISLGILAIIVLMLTYPLIGKGVASMLQRSKKA